MLLDQVLEGNMSKESPPDPAANFREMVTKWERGFDSLANQVMGTEGYSRSMNQMQDLQLGMQAMFKEFMTQNLTNANMPTRDDLVRLAESVGDLDRRMARIESLLEAMVPSNAAVGSGPRKGPPRTKKPPSAKAKGSKDGKK
jgi:hypothetical protein